MLSVLTFTKGLQSYFCLFPLTNITFSYHIAEEEIRTSSVINSLEEVRQKSSL